MKSDASKTAKSRSTGEPFAVTFRVPAVGKFEPKTFSIIAPDAFFLTLTLVICGPTRVPATISLEKLEGAGLMLRNLTVSGPTLFLIDGFSSRTHSKLESG